MTSNYNQQYLDTVKAMAASGMEVHLVLADSLRAKSGQSGAPSMPDEVRNPVRQLATSTLELTEFSAEQLVSRNADASQARTKAVEGHKLES